MCYQWYTHTYKSDLYDYMNIIICYQYDPMWFYGSHVIYSYSSNTEVVLLLSPKATLCVMNVCYSRLLLLLLLYIKNFYIHSACVTQEEKEDQYINGQVLDIAVLCISWVTKVANYDLWPCNFLPLRPALPGTNGTDVFLLILLSKLTIFIHKYQYLTIVLLNLNINIFILAFKLSSSSSRWV